MRGATAITGLMLRHPFLLPTFLLDHPFLFPTGTRRFDSTLLQLHYFVLKITRRTMSPLPSTTSRVLTFSSSVVVYHYAGEPGPP